MTGLGHELLQELDRKVVPPAAPEAKPTPATRADISGVLEAIQFAASSMSAMTERIEQLDAHSQAFEASNQELEEQNRQLTLQLGEEARSRDVAMASLEAAKERVQHLETVAAQNIARANVFERELNAARTDLTKIAEVVRDSFGVTA